MQDLIQIPQIPKRTVVSLHHAVSLLPGAQGHWQGAGGSFRMTFGGYPTQIVSQSVQLPAPWRLLVLLVPLGPLATP